MCQFTPPQRSPTQRPVDTSASANGQSFISMRLALPIPRVPLPSDGLILFFSSSLLSQPLSFHRSIITGKTSKDMAERTRIEAELFLPQLRKGSHIHTHTHTHTHTSNYSKTVEWSKITDIPTAQIKDRLPVTPSPPYMCHVCVCVCIYMQLYSAGVYVY